MRVLLTTQPGEGHWRPVAALGKALQVAKHEVVFATTPVFCQIVEGHGFRAVPIGVDDWLENPAVDATQAGQGRLAQAGSVLLEQFIPRAERNLPELIDLCCSWHPDLIVREQTEFAGYLAAEALHIPHAALQISAYRPHLERTAATALNRLRRGQGLPSDPVLATLYRYLFLLTFPPDYFDPDVALPGTARAIRLASYDFDQPEVTLPEWVTDDSAKPTIYATLGTAYSHMPGLFEAILAGLRNEPITLIVTTTHFDASHFERQPANVHIERYLPQSLLLPHCDLVVTHGGSGTVRAALSHGLPMVIIPIAADQPDNARRCAELGVAETIAPQQRTPQAIRRAVRQVLDDPGYRHRAERLKLAFDRLPGVEHAAVLLEKLAAAPR